MTNLVPGAVLGGDYRILRQLSSGGMGKVYVVEQLSTGKHRALKVMLPEVIGQPGMRRRFDIEARVGARIASDHVVEVLASGVDDSAGLPWLVMELLEGEDLASAVRRRGRISPSDVCEIFHQLCHALGEAHKAAIVHRDLKPENIFLARSRRHGSPFMVKVLDFGIARLLTEARTATSATRAMLGTPLWMAPEQAEIDSDISPATDVWALGLIGFYLLTGHHFWKAASAEAPGMMMLMVEAFAKPIPTASARATEYGCGGLLPARFDGWFARCVTREPASRFSDASAAFAALDELLRAASEDGPAKMAGTTPSPEAIGDASTVALSPMRPAADRRAIELEPQRREDDKKTLHFARSDFEQSAQAAEVAGRGGPMDSHGAPKNIEVHTDGVLPLLLAFERFPSIAKRYLLDHGLATEKADGRLDFRTSWMPLYGWISMLRAIMEQIGKNTLFAGGAKIMANTRFPPTIRDIAAGLRLIDVAYHSSHRIDGTLMFNSTTGRMLDGIGHYAFEQAPEKGEIRMICDTPYPCPVDFGIVTGIAKKFEPSAVVVHDTRTMCRMDGGERCIYVVTW